MKILKVFLCKPYDISGSYTDNLDDFLKYVNIVKKINSSTKRCNYVVETTCLAALDFKYFGVFDKIIVYGKYKYTEFIRRNAKQKLNKAIIEHHTYPRYGEKIEIKDYCTKEIKYDHHLETLMTHGTFKLNQVEAKITDKE